MTSFREFSQVCRLIENTPGSLDMTTILAELLLRVTPEELPVVTHFVMGEVFPAWSSEEVGIGAGIFYTALAKSTGLNISDIKEILRDTGDIGKTASRALKKVTSGQSTFSSFLGGSNELSILEVFERFWSISRTSGKGSQANKIKNLQYLFSSASPQEISYISRLAVGELRIGVGEGIVRDAISEAFDVPVKDVERSFMLTNDLGLVAASAHKGGKDALSSLGLELNRPIRMMLAQVTPSLDVALSDIGTAAVEWKFDGARVQIHKQGGNVTLFSRKLENITESLPDIVEAVKNNVSADSAILDGEAVAIDEHGRPRAFQETLKRFRRKYDIDITAREIPLVLNLFDIMYLNGEDLIELPLVQRREKLKECVANDERIRVDTLYLTDDPEKILNIYNDALRAGHEGVMIKNPDSPYSPGKRGKNWLKKKPVMETLDLAVIGAEWGYGRRTSFLGSYALACHDPDTGLFLPVGRVATGFSDEQLSELTGMFKDLIVMESGTQVEVRPEIIFEVAFEEIQKSTNYGSGYALRFPRLVNVRIDKSIEDVETIGRIEELYLMQRQSN